MCALLIDARHRQGENPVNRLSINGGGSGLTNVLSQLRNLTSTIDGRTLLLALSVRLFLAPFTGHPYDLPIWLNTGKIVAELKSPYDLARPIGYAGIWPIWLGISYLTASAISPANNYVYTLLIKLPIVAADFLVPNLIVKLVTVA